MISNLSHLIPITEAASEYYEMLRYVPVLLENGKTITIWDIADKIIDRKSGGTTPKIHNPIREYSDLIRKTFRRRDRIVWAMRFIKYLCAIELSMMCSTIRQLAPEDFFSVEFGSTAAKEQPGITEILSKLRWLPLDLDWFDFPDQNRVSGLYGAKKLANEFQHIMHFTESQGENTEISRYVFDRQSPEMILSDLKRIERRIQEQAKSSVAIKGVPILRLKNGTWFDLQTPYCDLEGRAMGHCGNAGGQGHHDQTILSFRTPSKIKSRWVPHLTFILHDGSWLGEMKGHGNSKPSTEYHNAIVALLKLPLVKEVGGGGYLPSANFCLFVSKGMSSALNGWTDLSDDLAKSLHDARPEIYFTKSEVRWDSHGHQVGGSAPVCMYCRHTIDPHFEIPEGEGRSLPFCTKFRKVAPSQATLDQKISQLDSETAAG